MTPTLATGQVQIIPVPATPALREYARTLADRAQAVRSGHVSPQADNLTLEEVGELFGLTRERIRQLEEIALPKFAAALREVLKPSPKARNLAVKMVKPSGQLTPEEARRSRQAEAAEMKAAKIVHYGSRDVSPRCGLVLPRNAKMVLDMAQVSCRICVRLGPLQRPKPDAKAAPRVESWVAVAFGPSR
jgi:hypothetical protein